MRILGFNALNHDAAVCVIEDGEILLYGCHLAAGEDGKEFVNEIEVYYNLIETGISASDAIPICVIMEGNFFLFVIYLVACMLESTLNLIPC